jgi:hypothetical protein
MTVNAQVLYGSITGTVSDTAGAVIPGVAVTITDQGTKAVRSTTANGQGTYLFIDVLPGVYTVSVPAKGNFGGSTVKNTPVEINRQVRVDITLKPASVSTQITVTEAPPILQTETADVNHEINSTQLGQLPLTGSQGRNFQALYTIIPGTTNVKEQNSTASNPSRAMSVQVNGMNFDTNTTRIDGAMNYYGWLTYLIAYIPPADSIATINVDTNSFNAEQGQAGGAAISITTKSGGHDFHGSAWEYYQDGGINARAYTATQASLISSINPTGAVPKNVFNEFGFNIGGPVYLPKILTGKKKLFFFDNFERTTRKQLISGLLSIPDSKMITGDFSEVGPTGAGTQFLLYDPQPLGVGPILPVGSRPTFASEYATLSGTLGTGFNGIPTTRQNGAAKIMMANMSNAATALGTPTTAQLNAQLANDYNGTASFSYLRKTNDAKITYIPNDSTQIFGKYSIEPFLVTDPQTLGAAGGGTFDGGQPGAGAGRIQNVGLGASHVFSPKVVMDFDFGYTRQVSGAQSMVDIADGEYGLNTLKIPGTNSADGNPNYEGQPMFAFGPISSSGGSTLLSSIGNANGANPFLFRDNQFTGDVNLSWVKGKHTAKFGFTYYHFDLNHFQPTSGSYVNHASGGFGFQGGMTAGGSSSPTLNAYNTLADFLLGMPNMYGVGPAVAKAQALYNPNTLRWTEMGAYAQDQWVVTPKLTVNYGVRYEIYPAPYRDHTGLNVLDPNLPQTGNVIMGGVNGEPQSGGLSEGYGNFAPRLGAAYRLTEKTVVRSGYGISTDPESYRVFRDAFPMTYNANYTSGVADSIALDPTNGNAPMLLNNTSPCPGSTCTYGIPTVTFPNISSGIVSLPVSLSTTTSVRDIHRGYIESWNLFVQRELWWKFVGNVGYVGAHAVRQFVQSGYLNSSPLPTASTPCMSNGHYNPSLGLGNGKCNFNINQIINQQWCTGTACYNTGGIATVLPLFGAEYNALQSQLTYNGGTSKQLGVVYTYSHAIDFTDNGIGTGSGGLSFNYPAYYNMNRATAGFDMTHNLSIWGMYNLPFGHGHAWANKGIADEILGGWQLNGQFSHISGTPFSVSASSNTVNAQSSPAYAQLIAPYHQLGGHARTAGSPLNGKLQWFDPTSFANPTEPSTCATGDSGCSTPNGTAAAPAANPVFANTNRNEFRGPGVSYLNMSLFKGFKVYRTSEFQIRFEAFNVANHALLYNNPSGTTVGGSTFGYITSFGPAYSPTMGARSLQFGGRFNF